MTNSLTGKEPNAHELLLVMAGRLPDKTLAKFHRLLYRRPAFIQLNILDVFGIRIHVRVGSEAQCRHQIGRAI